METINYFSNNGGPLYVCLLDLTKAFDHVKHSILFRKLSDKIPPLFLRLIIISYLNQSCCVRWEGAISSSFTVSNGVRQGAVASPKYFNVYSENLFSALKDAGLGCYIDSFFYGVIGYADDFALLSPSRDGLQRMINICDKYFSELGIKISVNVNPVKSKTKCLSFNVTSVPAKLSLYDMELPWVDSHIHLGHVIPSDENTKHDVLRRKGEFISKVHSLRQEVGTQCPDVFMFLVQSYLSSMYGSNLWDIYGVWTNKMFIAWNSLIRTEFNLPFATHRYILFNISKITHIRVSLIKRFVKFYQKLESCHLPEVRFLFHKQRFDCRSVFGRNCYNLQKEFKECNIANIDISQFKKPYLMLDENTWRLPFLEDLLHLRDANSDIPIDHLQAMIDYVCCQ